VERAARSSRRKVARFGLLTVFLAACAAMQEPPGGPPDFDPPVILAVTPDSGTVVAGLDDPAEIQFDEVIDERSGSGLENLLVLSPRSEELDVSWKRQRITVKPKDGWRDSVVYQLTLLPGFADLRNNRLDSGRTVVFSTGVEIPDTRIGGTVLNWDEGSAAPRALIEAILMPDSLVYVSSSDSVGDFEIKHLSPGSYLLLATVDQNNNRLREYREIFDSLTVQLDSTSSHVLWAFAHDTVGPRISETSEVDSVTVKVDFNQKLAPGAPPDSAVRFYALPDTTLLGVVALWNQPTYDSVRMIEDSVRQVEDSIRQAAVADSVRAAEEAADTARAEGVDTTGAERADTTGADRVDTTEAERAEVAERTEARGAAADSIVEGLLQVVDSAGQAPEDSAAAADTSRATLLLSERPQLSDSWYVRLAAAMVPGARYLVSAVAHNVSGAVGESQGMLILPEPEPVDTAQAPADTSTVPPDTSTVPPDTSLVPPGTT